MMNQEKIGSFIAEMRKEQNMTQKQLAEQVGVSDKTVSKWETGRSMPDNGVLLELCAILHISVNELLSGEKFSKENYVDKAEENMLELMKENSMQKEDRHWSFLGIVVSGVMLLLACLGVILSWGGVQAVGYFFDVPTLFYVVAIFLLIMVFCGTFGDFCRGFSFVYGKKEATKETLHDAWIAVKVAMCAIA